MLGTAKFVRLAIIASVALFALGASAQPEKHLREVNVTADSAPGWLPSVAQSQLAEKAALAYLAAEDAGKASDAYGFFADLNKQNTPFAEYEKNVKHSMEQLGPVLERRIVRVTWTKDSPQAPVPGIFAAIDFASRFTKADRHCGYIVLYQAREGDEFKVMREEANFIDNETAARVAPGEVDRIWAQLSANCPNYPSH